MREARICQSGFFSPDSSSQSSHGVKTAEAGLLRARGTQAQAKSQYFPQLSGALGYQRAVQSQFQEIQKRDQSSSSSSSSSGSSSSSSSSSSNSFGSISKICASPVTETMTLNFSQNVFTAGKLEASNAQADALRTAADIGLDAAKAQVMLEVAQAYYDAVASAQLTEIASLKPDAVFVFFAGAGAGKFVKDYDAAGLRRTIPLYGTGFLTDGVLEALSPAPQHVDHHGAHSR